MDDISIVTMCAVLSSAQIYSGSERGVLWYNRFFLVAVFFWCYIYAIQLEIDDASSDISIVSTNGNMTDVVQQMSEGSS